MLVPDVEQVGSVVRRSGRCRNTVSILYALIRLPRCLVRVRPTQVHVVKGGEALSHRQPRCGMSALIQGGSYCISLQSFKLEADGRLGWKGILHTQLVGALVADAHRPRNYLVTCSIDVGVKLVSHRRVNRSSRIGQCKAIGTGERAIRAGVRLPVIAIQTRSRIAAGAIRFPLGIESTVRAPVLTG